MDGEGIFTRSKRISHAVHGKIFRRLLLMFVSPLLCYSGMFAVNGRSHRSSYVAQKYTGQRTFELLFSNTRKKKRGV